MSNKSSFDKYIEEYRRTPDSVLLDVRTAAEYNEGHVPESINIPLDELEYSLDADPQTRVFVYCRSGSRSASACLILQNEDFDAINIGGIQDYHGPLE